MWNSIVPVPDRCLFINSKSCYTHSVSISFKTFNECIIGKITDLLHFSFPGPSFLFLYNILLYTDVKKKRFINIVA